MKNKIQFYLNILSIVLFIAFVPMFILWACFVSNPYDYYVSIIFLCLWIPFLVVGLILYLLTFKTANKFYIEYYLKAKNYFLNYNDSIRIKAKKGKVLINTVKQTFKYKKAEVKFNEIVEFQLVNNQTIVEKSGTGEAFVGGMLFGGSGAIAGAMVGKKQKIKDHYRVFIKTNNIKHAGIVVSLKVENAYNLFETLKLTTNKT